MKCSREALTAHENGLLLKKFIFDRIRFFTRSNLSTVLTKVGIRVYGWVMETKEGTKGG